MPVDFKLKVGHPPQILHVAQAGDAVMQQLVFWPGGQAVGTAIPVRRVKSGALTLY